MRNRIFRKKPRVRHLPLVGIFLMMAALVFIWSSPAQAQRGAYPSAPVKVIVGFPPGGGVDVVARLIGQKLDGVLGQTGTPS
jgi:tripartite-type tricarboxylate transporter receptor subunit TctC